MKQVYNEILKQTVWQAEPGKIFKRKLDQETVGTMLVKFAPTDSIDNYEEVDIPEEEIANE